MRPEFKIVLSHFVALCTAVLALLASIATAYFRDQVTAGLRWILWPLAARLPWNHSQRPSSSGEPVHELVSLFTVVQLRIFEPDGSHATYDKTSDYEVRSATLAEYREGVTAEGTATNFATLVGRITETIKEHGFYISRIGLGNLLHQGARFQNTYSVDLVDSFLAMEEHWTQEIAVPSEYLTMRVVFPTSRPPSLLRCKLLNGLEETQLPTSARLVHLHGYPIAVWELPHPFLGAIYKLEWVW
jgi:hypothetical protein